MPDKKKPATESTAVATPQASPFKKGQVLRVDFVSPLGKADPDKAIEATVISIVTYGQTGEYANQLVVKSAKGTGAIHDSRVIRLI